MCLLLKEFVHGGPKKKDKKILYIPLYVSFWKGFEKKNWETHYQSVKVQLVVS